MNIQEILHKRILVAKAEKYQNTKSVIEWKVLEISPSENWVKIMDMDGRKFWVHTSDVQVVETLAALEKSPGKKNQ